MENKYCILLHEGRDGHQVRSLTGDQDLLRYLQQTVRDGFIEIVRPVNLPEPYILVVNVEGILRNMEINPLACWLYNTQEHGAPIVGPAVILKEVMSDDGPDLGLLTKEDVKKALSPVWKAHAWCAGHRFAWSDDE